MLAAGKRRVCCFDRSGFYSKSLSAPNLEKSQISVCDFSTSLQIGVGSRFAEAAGAGLTPQVRHMVRIGIRKTDATEFWSIMP